MKRSTFNMSKPSTNRLHDKLDAYKCNTKSEKLYTVKCKRCGKDFSFKEKELKDKIYRCPDCGFEEIFFYFNFN